MDLAKFPEFAEPNGIWCFQFTLSARCSAVHCMQKILLFIHANLFNPRSWSLLEAGDNGRRRREPSQSINYEHLCEYDSTSWKRIKRTDLREDETPAVRVSLPEAQIARLLCPFVWLNELLEMGQHCMLQKRAQTKEKNLCATTNDQLEFVYFIFIIFQFLFCCWSLSPSSSPPCSEDNKMSINIFAVIWEMLWIVVTESGPGGSHWNLCCRWC